VFQHIDIIGVVYMITRIYNVRKSIYRSKPIVTISKYQYKIVTSYSTDDIRSIVFSKYNFTSFTSYRDSTW